VAATATTTSEAMVWNSGDTMGKKAEQWKIGKFRKPGNQENVQGGSWVFVERCLILSVAERATGLVDN
jgi:hypothetical protein